MEKYSLKSRQQGREVTEEIQSIGTCEKEINTQIRWKILPQTKTSNTQITPSTTEENETQTTMKPNQQVANTQTNKVKTKEIYKRQKRTDRQRSDSSRLRGRPQRLYKGA